MIEEEDDEYDSVPSAEGEIIEKKEKKKKGDDQQLPSQQDNTKKTDESLEKAKVYLELSLKTDEVIQQAYTKLTDKIKSIFTLASGLIPAVGALGYFIAKETSAYWILFPIFLSISAFVFAICLGINIFRPKSFKYVKPREVLKEFKGKGKSLKYIINRWASVYCTIADKNAEVVNSAEKQLNYMYSCIVIGLAILTVSFLLLGLSYTNLLQYLKRFLV